MANKDDAPGVSTNAAVVAEDEERNRLIKLTSRRYERVHA